jgi:hypothetical protein
MVRRLVALALLAGCGARAPEPETPGRTAQSLGVLPEVERAACDEHPVWCKAARGFPGGSLGDLAQGGHVVVGLTIGLKHGEPAGEAFEDVSVSVLAWRRTGGGVYGRIVELVPANDEEKLEVSEARLRILAVLDGEAPTAPLPPKLAADLPTFILNARYAITAEERGWILHGKAVAELRRVEDSWVVIEVPPEGPRGVFLSVFTDRWSRAE